MAARREREVWRHTRDNSQDRHQGRTNTARLVAGANELCTVAPTICGSWVRNLVHVTQLAPGILIWLQYLRKICAPWCSFLPKGLLHWKLWGTEPKSQGCVNCKCISVPQVAWHVILCVSQSTNPQGCTMNEMQILCSESCAGFATNVCSGEGFTCAVNYVLSHKAIISNYTQQVPSSKACSFSASL